ncbi:hypothetical protein FGB62_25g41 [Gracilaria domingensis]|nr:hypothetical protein FGB62_25g41 [Gracilaria domingensis]
MPAMSNIKVDEDERSVNWKDIARLFYDFDSGEPLRLPSDCGVTEIAIQMGICARLFQNGFEEDANAVLQRMISHDRDMEAHENSPALDDLLGDDSSDKTTTHEGTQKCANVRMQPAPGDKREAPEGVKHANMNFQNEDENTERGEFDLFGTDQSNGPEMPSERADWSINS